MAHLSLSWDSFGFGFTPVALPSSKLTTFPSATSLLRTLQRFSSLPFLRQLKLPTMTSFTFALLRATLILLYSLSKLPISPARLLRTKETTITFLSLPW